MYDKSDVYMIKIYYFIIYSETYKRSCSNEMKEMYQICGAKWNSIVNLRNKSKPK